MFHHACRAMRKTLVPIVIAWKNEEEEVQFGIGAGMILNKDGWVVTAGHILGHIAALDVAAKKVPKVTHYVSIFGKTKANLQRGFLEGKVDLGVGKLEGYVPPSDQVFPCFRIREVEQGEMLCRVGYPFIDGIRPGWDGKRFTFTNLFPVPLFANEALVSRFVDLGSGQWIETSSPGLKGQSGGPLVDTDGFICGLQVNTHHYPLEFEGAGRNQVLNVGRAVHVETIRKFLEKHGIKHLTEHGNEQG